MMIRFFLCCFISTTLLCIEVPREKLLSLIGGEWVTKSIYTATELDIAGHLLEGPKNIETLSELTKTDTESLYRLMRLLASTGVFYEEENRIFRNTTTSELLAKDHPESLRSLYRT